MDTVGERVRAARNRLGWSQDYLAKRVQSLRVRDIHGEVSAQSIQNLESNRVKNPRYLEPLAQALQLPVELLVYGPPEGVAFDELVARLEADGAGKAAALAQSVAAMANTEAGGSLPAMLPVLQLDRDGDRLTLRPDPVDWHQRPPCVARAPGAYCVYVPTADTWTRLRSGDLVVINPALPAIAGADVLYVASAGAPRASSTLGRLIQARDDGSVVLVEYLTGRESTLTRTHHDTLHRVAAIIVAA